MTYRELLAILQKLEEDQLDVDVTVGLHFTEEAYPVKSVEIVEEDSDFEDILDYGHPIIIVNDDEAI
jgi:hypothetical protein